MFRLKLSEGRGEIKREEEDRRWETMMLMMILFSFFFFCFSWWWWCIPDNVLIYFLSNVIITNPRWLAPSFLYLPNEFTHSTTHMPLHKLHVCRRSVLCFFIAHAYTALLLQQCSTTCFLLQLQWACHAFCCNSPFFFEKNIWLCCASFYGPY